MSERYVVVLRTKADRQRAEEAVRRAPEGYRVTFQAPKRSDSQNDKLHAMIRDVAKQVKHANLDLSVEDWKVLFMDALDRETRMAPNLDNTGYVQLGRSTAALGVKQMQDLILVIQAYGDQHGVVFKSDAGLEPTR